MRSFLHLQQKSSAVCFIPSVIPTHWKQRHIFSCREMHSTMQFPCGWDLKKKVQGPFSFSHLCSYVLMSRYGQEDQKRCLNQEHFLVSIIAPNECSSLSLIFYAQLPNQTINPIEVNVTALLVNYKHIWSMFLLTDWCVWLPGLVGYVETCIQKNAKTDYPSNCFLYY